MLAAVKGYCDGTQIILDENDRKSLNNDYEGIFTVDNSLYYGMQFIFNK